MPAVIRMRNMDFGMRKKTHLLIPQSVFVFPHSTKIYQYDSRSTHQVRHT